jgi:hypothetical protein
MRLSRLSPKAPKQALLVPLAMLLNELPKKGKEDPRFNHG